MVSKQDTVLLEEELQVLRRTAATLRMEGEALRSERETSIGKIASLRSK
jgi:hypothetical protein